MIRRRPPPQAVAPGTADAPGTYPRPSFRHCWALFCGWCCCCASLVRDLIRIIESCNVRLLLLHVVPAVGGDADAVRSSLDGVLGPGAADALAAAAGGKE